MFEENLSLQAVDYVVAAVILLVPVGIGIFYALKDAKKATRAEYLLGGRQMSVLPVATSLFITYIAGIALIGIPAEVSFFGFIYSLLPLGHALSYLIGFYTIVPLMYPLHITSIYEYIQLRYKSRWARIFCTLIGLLTQISYMSVNILAPALALEASANIPLWMSIIVLGILGTIYTAIGGIKSVIWTDAFQTFIVYFGVFLIIIKACLEVGGLGQVWELALKGGRLNFNKFSIDPRVRHTVWSLTFGLAFGRLVVSFNQSTLQRISCMKSLRDARIMFALNIPLTIIFDTILAVTGLAIYAYFSSKSCDPFENGLIKNRNQITPFFVLHAMNDLPGMAGLFVSVLCCSSLSTLSSGINSLAANTVEDLLEKPLRNLKEKTITLITKCMAMFFGCLIVALTWLASGMDGPVNQIAGIFFGTLGSPITGVFLLGGAVPWVNKFGAVTGALVSLTFNLWVSLGSIFSGVKYPSLPSAGTDGCHNGTSSIENHYQYLYSKSTTSSLVTPGTPQGSGDRFFLYSITYEWYSIMGTLVCVFVGLTVSYITNRYAGESYEEWKSTEAKYIFPFARRFWGMISPIDDENKAFDNRKIVIPDEDSDHMDEML